MEILVVRVWPTTECVTGTLSIDGVQKCFTLEPTVREISGLPVEEWKKQDVTAIPRGRYKVEMQPSTRFGHMTPHLLDVPGFEDIEIHGGNWAKDTHGCILIAMKRYSDLEIGDAEPAIEEVYNAIVAAEEQSDEVWITIQ